MRDRVETCRHTISGVASLRWATPDRKLADFPIQVGPLNPQRLRGFGHSPAMLVQDRGYVVPFESTPGFPQRATVDEARGGTVQPDVCEDIGLANHLPPHLQHESGQERAQFSRVPAPGER